MCLDGGSWSIDSTRSQMPNRYQTSRKSKAGWRSTLVDDPESSTCPIFYSAASVSSLEEAKNAVHCLYIQMPVQDVCPHLILHLAHSHTAQYGTLQWSKFDELQALGYKTALAMLQKWESEGRLPSSIMGKTASSRKRGRGVRRNSV